MSRLLKAEAQKRMRLLGLPNTVIDQLFKDGTLYVSYGPAGSLLPANAEILNWVSKFEKESNTIIYHILRGKYRVLEPETNTMISVFLDTALYVSLDEKPHWANQRMLLKCGETHAYVRDNDLPSFSKFQDVELRKKGEGLIRSDIVYDITESEFNSISINKLNNRKKNAH